MQIIVPMTGNGSRFKSAGYQTLKPFINVGGKPIIEWVRSMFNEPDENITFICRDEHLTSLPYVKDELHRISPGSNIFSVSEWQKKGPVYDVMQYAHLIKDNEPVLVTYCDYFLLWDYDKFKKDTKENGCEGAVPCYTGFHPHLIPEKNLYASCKVDKNENLIEIKEKFSWTKDKTKSLHSPGVYYFKTGAIMKEAFQLSIDENDSLNGEFYASLPFNKLVEKGMSVWCPANVTHFCQWGTPEDLQQYNFWMSQINGWNK